MVSGGTLVPVRRLGLFLLGFYAGLLGAAALVRRALPSLAPTLKIEGTAGFGGVAIGAKAND
jgi:hypothetical protein